MIKKISLFILVLLTMSGCMTTSKHILDAQTLKPDEGLLVMEFNSSIDLYLSYQKYDNEHNALDRLGDEFFGTEGGIQIRKGKSYLVIPLKAKEYMFSRISTGYAFSLIKNPNKFEIYPNTITYIGHLNYLALGNRYRITTEDKQLDISQYLKNDYPVYTENMDIKTNLVEF